MIIRNTTRNIVIGKNAVACNDAISKATGLMFSRKRNIQLILKFEKEKKVSLHMFFVFYSIDVLFLDKRKVVVDMKETFKPFSVYRSQREAMYAVELPSGAVKKSKTEIGHRIEF